MRKAAVVIGANYGDEGKGLITDYLAAQSQSNTVVIRFNGGAQAGHTVQRPDGLRHVFSHFSSGTFAGAQTYLSEFFIANPILFTQELEKLNACGYSPKVTIHPDALITTPYDMVINQAFENFMGKKRHGSCGVGISETIERNLHPNFRLTAKDLLDQHRVKEKVLRIRDEWFESRFNQLIGTTLSQRKKDVVCSNTVLEHFLKELQTFLSHCSVSSDECISDDSNLIFEGAQGLLLDQQHNNFPHVTRSNTGIQNVSIIANQLNIKHLDIHYVTRAYLTRHGAGPLPREYANCPHPHFKDDTNVPHEFQGSLRFAPLNLHSMQLEIAADLKKLSKNITQKVTLAVTCLDQLGEKIALVDGAGNKIELEKETFLKQLIRETEFDQYIVSDGATRENCKHICTTAPHIQQLQPSCHPY